MRSRIPSMTLQRGLAIGFFVALASEMTAPFTIALAAALSITTPSQLPVASVGSSYSQTFTATGGTMPYKWQASGSLPDGLTFVAGSGELKGTPTQSGTYHFTIQVTDKSGAQASASVSLQVVSTLTISTASVLPDAQIGVAYTVALQAQGGVPPYQWTVNYGALPGGLNLKGSGQISGTPSAAGIFNFAVQVTDSVKNSVTQPESLAVGLSKMPAISIGGFSGTMSPLQQPRISVTLAEPFGAAIAGTLALTFKPSGSNPMNDPAIQFSTGGRTANFIIAANAMSATFSSPQLAVQTGSVEGSITLSITSLQSGSSSLPIPGGASQTAEVGAAPPAIQSIKVVQSTGGFELQITAVADTRDLTQASVAFQPVAGTNLQTSQLILPLTSIANSWFQSSSSAAYGGLFVLTLPFTFNGNVSLASVSAVLTSSAGSSALAVANY
jgi:hypothetical protein